MPNRSDPRGLVLPLSSAMLSLLLAMPSVSVSQDSPAATAQAAAKELKSPVPVTKDSISAGRKLFATYCTRCHGNDGKAQLDVVANATDLTAPIVYSHGTSPGEIYRSISDGAGLAMPPFKTALTKEEDRWHLVNFVRNLWPSDKRPPVEGG